jgi:hypothetical protein
MALTLMVYTLAERKLCQALEDQNQTVRDNWLFADWDQRLSGITNHLVNHFSTCGM